MKLVTLKSHDAKITLIEVVDTQTQERKVVGYVARAAMICSLDSPYSRVFLSFSDFRYQPQYIRVEESIREVKECVNVEILSVEEFDHRFM